MLIINEIHEIAEDTIPPLPPKERSATIRRAVEVGLEVFTEIGLKYPDKPLDVLSTEIDTIAG